MSRKKLPSNDGVTKYFVCGSYRPHYYQPAGEGVKHKKIPQKTTIVAE